MSDSSSDDGVNIRTMVSGFMSKPETIIFAVEAASCEDFATSHIAPLIKYALNLYVYILNKDLCTVCMYVCMYVCVYMVHCTYICTAYILICVHLHTSLYARTNIHAYIHTVVAGCTTS